MVDVQVHVQDAQSVAPCPRDSERGVVVDAEPRGAVRHRVVQAAAGMERMLHVAPKDRLHRPERAAGDHRPGVVHAGERRVVSAHADPGRRRREGVPPRTA